MISKNFLPIINRPTGPCTRVTPHSCTLIDNIFCNRVDEVESSGVITTNISDHYPVFAREKFPTLPEDSISTNYRVFSDENLSIFKIHYKILTGTRYELMRMLMRHMIYSKVPYFLFLMNTSSSTLKTFLVVGKVNLGLLLVY